MIDVLLITPTDRKTQDWSLDIDIFDGYPRFCPYESTNDQRAAISAYQMKGTVPGAMDIGIDWVKYFTNNDQNNTLVEFSNAVNTRIQQNVPSNTVNDMYGVSIGNVDGKLAVRINRIGGDNG